VKLHETFGAIEATTRNSVTNKNHDCSYINITHILHGCTIHTDASKKFINYVKFKLVLSSVLHHSVGYYQAYHGIITKSYYYDRFYQY